ncbi:MAG: mercury resistance system periplasmic binding protein MerP [Moraxellaceae bacterium]|jgi:mercuric ion binding protein|nr:mercury resistance system periplasmic binding protein MerP [Moraxellaceae bacterium]MDZ4385626.1 mercury resistance system periplasmic binding protein MerP [Moraxellaceae bacterium]
MNKLFGFLVVVSLSTPVWSATQTITLSVPSMNCPACPFTVKRAISQVDGVHSTKISYEKREAIVTFDDAKTSSEILMRATEHAGYASTVKQQGAHNE